MAQFAIIRASDVGRYNRMDAPFHIARVRVEALTAHLEREHSAEQAMALLDGLPLDALRPLQPLLRGTRPITAETAKVAIRDYPHIALALVQESVHETIAAKAEEIRRHEAGMERLRALLPRDDSQEG